MSKTYTHTVPVHFGDCDPAGIVFFPNFARWMDQSSLGFFLACGVPPWRELALSRGLIGTPVLETSTRYLMPATYGETISVHTSVAEWRDKVFVHLHQIRRGDDLLCEGREVRAFVKREAGTGRLHAVPVPEDIKALCL